MIYINNTEGKKKNALKERDFIYRPPFVCVCMLINEDVLILNEDALI